MKNKLKVTYVELPDEILQRYSKEAIAMALMCTIDNWVNERMADLNAEY